MPDRDLTLEEKLWQDPDWGCPRCKSVNMGRREICRMCGLDSALISEGCLMEVLHVA